MTDSQSTYQVRLAWGTAGLTRLAAAGVVIVVDTLPDDSNDARSIAAQALSADPATAVFAGSLRNASATATAVYQEQLDRGGRTAINLVLVGDGGVFAVEDYLAAGAIGNALTALGIDHSAPDVAVATEGYRALTRAVKHLVSATESGLELSQAGRRDEVKAAAEIDADDEPTRILA